MMHEYQRILVPVDGSKEADLAVTRAVQIVQQNQATLDILNVLDTRQFSGSYGNLLTHDVIYRIAEDSKSYLDEMQKKALAAGLKEDQVKIHSRFGDPKTVIALDFLKDYHEDLIVIGSTGLNAVERLLVGSVSAYVTRNALTDVMVVRPSREE
ncbi:universal stress protein [Lactobacillus sp. DCY120]|uniref:Universal stress protein n=1 Tax=Bombilactobacillus apium TaxID=2675299 RepID=A0A850RCA6_9LACO|nr:universal stress protein [Bombilactobacillus apium]NVY96418.1 universal stress protein [Bombilactobacillus apium]